MKQMNTCVCQTSSLEKKYLSRLKKEVFTLVPALEV
jgi:hypothetical protein